MGQNSLILQDDISRLSDSQRQARVGCDKIFDLLTRKQLSVNHTKCKYLIIGSKIHRKQALEELKIEPMKIVGLTFEHAVNEKYLGNYVKL